MTTAVAANVVLFTASMTILTDVGRFTVWAIHPSIMQRPRFYYVRARLSVRVILLCSSEMIGSSEIIGLSDFTMNE